MGMEMRIWRQPGKRQCMSRGPTKRGRQRFCWGLHPCAVCSPLPFSPIPPNSQIQQLLPLTFCVPFGFVLKDPSTISEISGLNKHHHHSHPWPLLGIVQYNASTTPSLAVPLHQCTASACGCTLLYGFATPTNSFPIFQRHPCVSATVCLNNHLPNLINESYRSGPWKNAMKNCIQRVVVKKVEKLAKIGAQVEDSELFANIIIVIEVYPYFIDLYGINLYFVIVQPHR